MEDQSHKLCSGDLLVRISPIQLLFTVEESEEMSEDGERNRKSEERSGEGEG